MAVQIRWPNGDHQWLKGDLNPGQQAYKDARGMTRYKDGFEIITPNARTCEFGWDVAVISLTPDYNVTDWSCREEP